MRRGTFIENEAAYERAKQARIRANAAKTRRAKWMEMPGAERAHDFLFEMGEFEAVSTPRDPAKLDEYLAKVKAAEQIESDNEYYWEIDMLNDMYSVTTQINPVVRASLGDFYTKMRNTVTDWGGLTEGQNAVVLGMIERGEHRVAERAKARAEQAKADADRSGWVGKIGERRIFDLTIRLMIEMEGQYGISFLHVCHDADGNVVVYKGTSFLGKSGETVRVKATVKEHDIRDGVKQTKIARPKEERA